MAVTAVTGIARVVLNTADAATLSRFYVDVLGFETIDGEARLYGLGPTRLSLLDVGSGARRYPSGVAGWDPRFQHCAIVVTDMARAMTRLEAAHGWTPISTRGPEQLPPGTGGVIAFKFRDPEGHPLEFLWLPDEPIVADRPAPFVRVDHSAISVADVARSIAFYEGLGLAVAGRTLNQGPEQERMDDVVGAQVDVVSMSLSSGSEPHLELLGYRGDHDRRVDAVGPDDIAATRIVFTVDDDERPSGPRRDPDGHWLAFETADR